MSKKTRQVLSAPKQPRLSIRNERSKGERLLMTPKLKSFSMPLQKTENPFKRIFQSNISVFKMAQET